MICELKEIDKYPNIGQSIDDVRNKVREMARIAFAKDPGGVITDADQFTMTTPLPQDFYGYAGTALMKWNQRLGSANTWVDIFNRTMPEDMITGIPGLAFPDPSLRITELRLEIADKKYARFNIEEAKAYEQPAIIFEEPFIINEEETLLLRGRTEAIGYYTIVPVQAVAAYKKKADVISESLG